MDNPVSLRRDGNVAIITIDNPPVNALRRGVRKGILDCVTAARDDASVEAIILTGAGRTFVAEHAPLVIESGGAALPFRAYEFNNQGQPLFVFFCLWETGHRDASGSGLAQAYTRRNLLERVRIGQRNLGQQSVEVIVSGPASAEAAAAAFRRLGPQLIAAGS